MFHFKTKPWKRYSILFYLLLLFLFFTNNRFAATCSGSYYWIKKFNTFQKYQKYTIMSLRTTIRQWLHKTVRYEFTVQMTSIGNSERKTYSIWEKCVKFRMQGLMCDWMITKWRKQSRICCSCFSPSRKCLPYYGAKSLTREKD